MLTDRFIKAVPVPRHIVLSNPQIRLQFQLTINYFTQLVGNQALQNYFIILKQRQFSQGPQIAIVRLNLSHNRLMLAILPRPHKNQPRRISLPAIRHKHQNRDKLFKRIQLRRLPSRDRRPNSSYEQRKASKDHL